MKKLLLASVAVGGLAMVATPAHADIELEVGGYFKGYGVFVDQDESTGDDTVFDFVRDTEIHIGGETTLDNGLTIGTHFEFDVDQADGTEVDESYVYFSGDWGRVNFGGEDGAGYLLQVAAPSADSNLDGLRQYVQPFATTGDLTAGFALDYDMDPTGKDDKLTYLSPVFSGFQLGATFTPDAGASSSLGGVAIDDDTAGVVQETWEVAFRYEGQFENVGVIAGAGYSHGSEEGDSATTDDLELWNAGLDLDIGAFGLGIAYLETNNGEDGTGATAGDTETMVVGADYTHGAFKFGVSWLNQEDEATSGVEYDRYTGGVNYEYGPGMSFRGSIQHLEQDNPTGTDDADGTALLLGTQINF